MKGDGGRDAEQRLAARYWDLLDYYPRRYREERGAELVGTLLDCARPGQRRPSRREARALVFEGLRMRAGTGGHRPARVTLAEGVRLGLLVLLVGMTVDGVTTLGTVRGYEDLRPVTVGWSVLVGLAVLAGVMPVVLLARGRFRLAVPFVVVAGAVDMFGYPWLHGTGWGRDHPWPEEWPAIVPIYLYPAPATVAVLGVLALALARWRPRPIGRPALAVAVLSPVLLSVPDWLVEAGLLPYTFEFYTPPVMLLILLAYLGILVYAGVDARPAAAVAFLFLVIAVEGVFGMLKFGELSVASVVVVLVLILPVATAAWLGARRQARISTPDLTR